jgi:hypothetical protein
MNVRPFSRPLAGEHVLGVDPQLLPNVPADRLRRPNLFTGRSLSEVALDTDQVERAARLAFRGQAISAGVIKGLDVTLERQDKADLLHIGPGEGIAATGEDVLVPRLLKVSLDTLPVFAPATSGVNGPLPVYQVMTFPDGPQVGKPMTFADVRGSAAARLQLTPALVVLLQPVVAEVDDDDDPNDPAPQDPDAYAYADVQLVDGCRVVLATWPTQWLPLPPANLPQWRNRLAAAIFERERTLGPNAVMPWEDLGLWSPTQLPDRTSVGSVPIALLGFGAGLRVSFVDRASVARIGGVPRERTPVVGGLDAGPHVAGRGGPRLWQARIRQLADHLADIDPTRFPAGTASAELRYLPPAGILPRTAVDVIGWGTRFFPPNVDLRAVPIPLEQVDAAIAASASLDLVDLTAFERIRLLVPVPEEDFEPALLDLRTTINPAFPGAIQRAQVHVAALLVHREDVRQKVNLVLNSIEGLRPYRFPAPDPEAVPDELPPADDGTIPAEDTYGTVSRVFPGDTPEMRVAALDALVETWPDGNWTSMGRTSTVDPVVVSSEAGRFDVFARGDDGHLWQGTFSGGSFQGWTAVSLPTSGPNPLLHDPVAARPFAVVSSGPGHLDLFARRLSDGELLHLWCDPTVTPTFWRQEAILHVASAPLSLMASDPVATVWPGANRFDVFYRGQDNLIYTATSKTPPDGTAGPLTQVSTTPILDGISAVSWGTGRIDLFARLSPGRQLAHWTFTQNATPPWSMEQLGGGLNSDPAAVSWGPGRIDVFQEALVNILGQRTFDGSWQSKVVGLGVMQHAGHVHAWSWGRGRLDVMVRGWDNILWHQWFDGQSWHGWQALGDSLLGEPAVVSWAPGYLDVFALRFDRTIWHRSKLPHSAPWGALETAGLQGVAAAYDAIVNRVDDTLNLGFTRAQAAIYRLRQQVLITDSASRLATSPVLAEIAKGDSAVATKGDVTAYLGKVQGNRLAVQPAARPDLKPTRVFISPDLLSKTVMPPLDAAPLGTDEASAVVRVRGQVPLPGATPIQRTLSIAQRMATPAAIESWQFAVSTKYDVLRALANLEIDLSGITVPGLASTVTVGGVATTVRFPVDLTALRQPTVASAQILAEPHPSDNDESGYFTSAVELVEHAIMGLRAVEGRVEVYRNLADLVRSTLDALDGFASAADLRLKDLADQIAEGRQNIVVARSLLAEEQVRVAQTVARRTALLTQHVPFLVYQRPRQGDVFKGVPWHALDSAELEDVIPAALTSAVAAPSELHTMIELLREAPVKWFTAVPAIFRLLDRLESVQRTIFASQERASSRSLASLPAPAAGLFGQGIARAFSAQMDVILGARRVAAAMDPAALSRLSWSESQQKAVEVASLGDLIDAGHGRADVARQAANELANIQKVATALYLRFGAVDPVLRLPWAQLTSQYEAGVDLRVLSNLPGWEQIASLDRREMAALASWLFSRVDVTQPQALALMNDVVRVALLLASHAPVNELIAGRVSKPTNVAVGGLVEVAVDESKIRVDMHALLDGVDNQAHAVVEDIRAGVARVRVLALTAGASSIHFSTSTIVRFAEPARGTVLFRGLSQRE